LTECLFLLRKLWLANMVKTAS